MITIRTQPWNSADTGKNHNLTIYQVGLTADFTLSSNILAEVSGDTNNKMLSIGKINLDLPEGTVWYTRFKRSFDDGTSEDTFSNPEPVYSSDVNNNKFIKSTSTIEKPSVRVEDKETYLYIESSEAKIDGSDGHLYTTILIYSAGELVYKNMKDEENLTSLSISINILNFKTLDMLTVYVIYGTSNAAESPAGKAILNTSKLKFSLAGKFNNIPYNKNEIYTLTSVDNNVIVSTAFLYNGAGSELGEYHLLTFLNKQDGSLNRYTEIYVDSEHLVPDSIYTLRINAMSDSGTTVEIKNYVITTEAMDSPFVVDRDYVYSTIESKIYNGGVNGYIPTTTNDSFNICLASNYKDILLSSVANPYSLSRFKFYPNNLELAVAKEFDLNISTINTPKYSFFTKDKRAIIVLAKDNSNIRIVEFTYNPFDNITLVKTSTVDYTVPNAISVIENGALTLSDDESTLFYLTLNGVNSELGKINITSHALTILASRPDHSLGANLINIGGDKLLSTKGNLSYDIFYLYSAETNDWASYGATYPIGSNFFNSNVGVLKRNGKVLLVPAKGTPAKYLVTLDVKEKTYTTDTVDIPESMVVSDIIREANGAFIIIVNDVLNPGSKGIIYYC